MGDFFRTSMWFKNLQIYRLPAPWTTSADQLASYLAPQTFTACSSLEMQSQGWVSPRGNAQLVHVLQRQFLLKLDTEKKLLPSTVINQVTRARAAELEEQQGFPPGRKQIKELKEQITDELLPRAFSIVRSTWTWIDPVNGWLVVDAGSPAKAEEVLKLLLKAIPKFPLTALRTVQSPLSSMTGWLASDEAPHGFTVDQDTELRASGDSKATVRFVRHTLEPDDVCRHIESGKQCTRLALSWNDRVSFVLTEDLSVKKVVPLDVLKEGSTVAPKNDDERFDGDFMLMAGEIGRLLADLVGALGGYAETTALTA
jgi:recombination associated protein RdgC